MKRLITTVAPLGAVVLLIVAVSAWAAPSERSRGDGERREARTITVIEHATTDVTTDTGAQGDSAGDILTFANDVFDATDTRKVGTDQGYCVRTVAGKAYECTLTTLLAGGQIVVNGPFYDAEPSTMAITGGTGRYRGASGSMDLEARENGAKFAFTFRLED